MKKVTINCLFCIMLFVFTSCSEKTCFIYSNSNEVHNLFSDHCNKIYIKNFNSKKHHQVNIIVDYQNIHKSYSISDSGIVYIREHMYGKGLLSLSTNKGNEVCNQKINFIIPEFKVDFKKFNQNKVLIKPYYNDSLTDYRFIIKEIKIVCAGQEELVSVKQENEFQYFVMPDALVPLKDLYVLVQIREVYLQDNCTSDFEHINVGLTSFVW